MNLNKIVLCTFCPFCIETFSLYLEYNTYQNHAFHQQIFIDNPSSDFSTCRAIDRTHNSLFQDIIFSVAHHSKVDIRQTRFHRI